MRQIRDVLRLVYDEKQSQRLVSIGLNIARRTISEYLFRFKNSGLSWPLADEIDDSVLEGKLFPNAQREIQQKLNTPDWAFIHESLKQKGSTLQVLHEEYLEQFPDGMQYSNFCRHYRIFHKSLRRWLRNTHKAGERVFVDYAGPTIEILNSKTGQSKKAQIFVGVLGASNYVFAEAVWSQKTANWIASHARMFEHFNGVPEVVVCDNLKAAVIRASKSNPVINPTYLDMAKHYGTFILPARPRKPKDKSKAEGGVLLVERWIMFRLRKRKFFDINELNTAISELLVSLNEKMFQKLPGSRLSRFRELDQPALKTLPLNPYVVREFRKSRVGMDYHIEVDGHFYSAPFQLSGKQVELQLTANTIEIIHGGRRVASHARNYEAGKTTQELHMDPAHRKFDRWDATEVLIWALSIGPATHDFLECLFKSLKYREQGYRITNSIKALAKEYPIGRLELACKRANEKGANEISSIRSILRNNLDRLPANTDATEASFDHNNIRGANYYH